MSLIEWNGTSGAATSAVFSCPAAHNGPFFVTTTSFDRPEPPGLQRQLFDRLRLVKLINNKKLIRAISFLIQLCLNVFFSKFENVSMLK